MKKQLCEVCQIKTVHSNKKCLLCKAIAVEKLRDKWEQESRAQNPF